MFKAMEENQKLNLFYVIVVCNYNSIDATQYKPYNKHRKYYIDQILYNSDHLTSVHYKMLTLLM